MRSHRSRGLLEIQQEITSKEIKHGREKERDRRRVRGEKQNDKILTNLNLAIQ